MRTRLRIAILGCTGSVGSSVMSVCRAHRETFEPTILGARHGSSKLAELAREFPEARLVLACDDGIKLLPRSPVAIGMAELTSAVLASDVDHLVIASSGVSAAPILQKAMNAERVVSLANKESAVLLGAVLAPNCLAGRLRPLDSEHNALWQCLRGEDVTTVRRVWLTASGGPFLCRAVTTFESITPHEAISHPVWSMGAKISVDSATLVNKGIEVIEACCLFGLPPAMVEPVVLPGSMVHGAVAFIDGAVKMLAGDPNMRFSALNCLGFPDRLNAIPLRESAFDLAGLTLNFERPDLARFPGLALCLDVVRQGGPWPIVLLAADQVAVEAFIEGRLSFPGITRTLGRVLDCYDGSEVRTLDERLALYERALMATREILAGHEGGWRL